MAKLCLNMIVRNEAGRIERCLKSLDGYVDCYAIVDTGSTDDTVQRIKDFYALRGIPGVVKRSIFVNFEQARNEALLLAWELPDKYDYILLVDADMVMVVEDKDFKSKLTAPSYEVVQKGGTTRYYNKRLVHRNTPGKYRGVTHEYLDCGMSAHFDGFWFVDHADGANRKDKFDRDIALLLKAMETEPNNERYQFYLAQSYREAGRHAQAADAYKKRVAMGGWDEEVWDSQFNYAHMLMNMGDEGGFIRELLVAYNMRPSRAETLYDLAKHYREKPNMQATALMFAKKAMEIPPSKDFLFVNDYVYTTGCREEVSITSFYSGDPTERDNGFRICNDLAMDRNGSDHSRDMARANLFYYIRPLSELAPTFSTRKINFTPPDGYVALNPSIAMRDDTIYAVIRCVNYTINELGQYLIRGGDGSINNANPIHTRNFLAKIDPDGTAHDAVEIVHDFGPPKFDLVIGFEDMRLFVVNKELWFSACVRQDNHEGMCEQMTGCLVPGTANYHVENLQKVLPKVREHEKNWMPWIRNGLIQWVYRMGKFVDIAGVVHDVERPKLAIDHFSGGSQLVPYKCGWLALVHEARTIPGKPTRYYQHRFVEFDEYARPQRVSRPFVFQEKIIEFAAGLAGIDGGFMISYGFKDSEAWLGTISTADVEKMLQ